MKMDGQNDTQSLFREMNKTGKKKKNFTDQHHEKQKGIKEIHPIKKDSAPINTCRGERVSLPAQVKLLSMSSELEPWCGSHTAILVPQGLSVLRAQRLL